MGTRKPLQKMSMENQTATSNEFYWFLSHTTSISVKHIHPKTDVMSFLEISIGRRLHHVRVCCTFGGQKQKWDSSSEGKTKTNYTNSFPSKWTALQ